MRFLISVGGSTEVPYRLVKVAGSNLVDVAEFTMIIPNSTYSVGNDSYYDTKTKQLYITKMKDNKVTYNRIYQYDLSGGLVHKKKYSASTIYCANADTESKYEIEGLGIYNGNIYVCTNSVENKIQTDSIDVLL